MDTVISILITLLASVVFAIVATVLGCLLAGLDRKVTARAVIMNNPRRFRNRRHTFSLQID